MKKYVAKINTKLYIKNIALAVKYYNETYPSGLMSQETSANHDTLNWRVRLLPFLGEHIRYQRIRSDHQSKNGTRNEDWDRSTPDVYLSPEGKLTEEIDYLSGMTSIFVIRLSKKELIEAYQKYYPDFDYVYKTYKDLDEKALAEESLFVVEAPGLVEDWMQPQTNIDDPDFHHRILSMKNTYLADQDGNVWSK
ncbi:MAG: DUF1559 domain-containing protein [Planctomycetes bacterium]|nr:DUF1559 domain-containing protein [Planctomycetota bacterium]MCH9723791.1 DUF1559 domain-containing protein [Planctomycetota bacterium]MCH9776103.1 DUF1559 domain-containing protein [Planctomycetota bacterium]MCH9791398.1 DUF1559 domain-containing protein [Planctomycetota bacterium]